MPRAPLISTVVVIACTIGFLLASQPWRRARKPAAPGWFTDITRQSGITFSHFVDLRGDGDILQTVGAGCAVFDYDNDGWMDLYFVQGIHRPGQGNVLYRSNGDGTFTDVTRRAGVAGHGYGMGCATGDYDGDGHWDLYVCNYGRNILFHNNGDGTFTDHTDRAGVAAGGWSAAAAFGDLNGDGNLDLYVARYADYGQPKPGFRGYFTSTRPPLFYPSEPDHLFMNQGDGIFRDTALVAGIHDTDGRGLGVLMFDYDDDGRQDIYVANDQTRNFLFHNLGDSRFRDEATALGAAYGPDGKPQASMGCDWGDYDGDGRMDIVIGNFQDEPDSLYRNRGPQGFEDAAVSTGLADLTRDVLTWGCGFLDYDNDGDLDIFQVNGHVQVRADRLHPPKPYRQPRQLIENVGGRYLDASKRGGGAITAADVGRGVAFGDLNNDGRVDLVISNSNRPAVVLRNDYPTPGNWLAIRLRDRGKNRHALGARLRATAGGRTQLADVKTSYSFTSANDPRVRFGIGPARQVDRLDIRWPDGRRSEHRNLPANREISLPE